MREGDEIASIAAVDHEDEVETEVELNELGEIVIKDISVDGQISDVQAPETEAPADENSSDETPDSQ
jgi:hypothetical protein